MNRRIFKKFLGFSFVSSILKPKLLSGKEFMKCFDKNYHEMVEVLQSEVAITDRSDKRPILASYAIGPCTGFLGIEKSKGVVFLAHYSSISDFKVNFGGFLYNLSLYKNRKNDNLNFDVYLIEGEILTKDVEDEILSYMNLRNDIKFLFKEKFKTSSIIVDSRDFTFYEYELKLNPHFRQLDELEGCSILHRCMTEQGARIIYNPRNKNIAIKEYKS